VRPQIAPRIVFSPHHENSGMMSARNHEEIMKFLEIAVIPGDDNLRFAN
jgi:hypothetical protein